jgi:3-oxoacyl-[acyl-carrier protein] reductase
MDLGIKGRRALVCGGSKGLGYSAAHRFAQEGAEVTIAARSVQSLQEAVEKLHRDTGARAQFVTGDVSTPAGRAAIIAGCPETDILVTHAGISQRFIKFNQLTHDDWIWWLNAHFFSAIELIHAYVPGMVERKFGRIVNVSVNFIKYPQLNAGHSHAARLALAGAIASLVRELAPHNVTINSVLPGPFQTDALRAALSERAARLNTTYEVIEAEMLKTVPAGRVADPQEAGDLIAMLASGQMGFVTGQNICNDGGQCPTLF